MHLVLIAAAAALGRASSWFDPWSVALGGLTMAGNVWLTQTLVRLALRPGGRARRAAALAVLATKFGVLLGAVGLLFRVLGVNGMSFAAGVAFFPLAAAIQATREMVAAPAASEN